MTKQELIKTANLRKAGFEQMKEHAVNRESLIAFETRIDEIEKFIEQLEQLDGTITDGGDGLEPVSGFNPGL